MLIGIDASRAIATQRTGTETYSWHIIRHLLQQSGPRFRLYSPHSLPVGLLADSRAAVETRTIPWPRLWTHVRLSAEMLHRPPDVLFVPAHVLPLLPPQHSVVTIHDLGYHYFPETHTPAARRYLELSTRWSAQRATALLADSHATKADLLRFTRARPEHVHVVYLGRDETLTPVQDEQQIAAVRQRLALPSRYILYVGTLHPRKNLVRLVEAFAPVHARHPDVHLVLAGKRGWLDEPISHCVQALGLTAAVHFPGFVAQADLPALFSGATCFAFPSLHEGFGFPVLEAQACGAPVLTANTSSLPEVAGDAALLVDPLDQHAISAGLLHLLQDESLRARLRLAGFSNIHRFSWQQCAAETLAVLQYAATQPKS
ncbi:MAG: glycosyltransferase family 1 protein [Caldilineales bacterium]